MFHLIIVLHSSQTNFQFSFKEGINADRQQEVIEKSRLTNMKGEGDSMIVISDDYGHHGAFLASDIVGSLVSDVAKEMKASIEKNILEARARIEGQQRAMNDPVLKLHANNAAVAAGVRQ